jgi:hypothetical protein
MLISEFSMVSGYFDQRTNQTISGTYDPRNCTIFWTVDFEDDNQITFKGRLFETRGGMLAISGEWQASDVCGTFHFFKATGGDHVEVPISTTRPLVIDDKTAGENIVVSVDGQTARRSKGYSDAICLSAAPLALVDDCLSYEVSIALLIDKVHCDESG